MQIISSDSNPTSANAKVSKFKLIRLPIWSIKFILALQLIWNCCSSSVLNLQQISVSAQSTSSGSGESTGPTLEDPTDGGKIGWRETMYPVWGTSAYKNALKTNYKFRNTDVNNYRKEIYYQTVLRVNPCKTFLRTGGRGEECCTDMNSAGCQDHPEVIAGGDLQIAYFQNAHIPSCIGTPFERDPNCGSTIEIHRKDDPFPVVADVRITKQMPDGFQTTYINTANLCVGQYELWFVVRTRAGPFVQARKDFSVLAPSCRSPTQDDVISDEETAANEIGVIIGRRKTQEQGTESTDSSQSESESDNAVAKRRLRIYRKLRAEGQQKAKENRANGGVQDSPEYHARLDSERRKLSISGSIYPGNPVINELDDLDSDDGWEQIEQSDF